MPFDQIYWNSGTAFRDSGESESSGTKDERVGATANANPNSNFAFLGNRRTTIMNWAQKYSVLGGVAASSPVHRHFYHNVGGGQFGRSTIGAGEVGTTTTTNYAGGAVNAMVAGDIPASAPAGTTLFDCQNRESAHTSTNETFMQNVNNFFQGIHDSDPLSITTTGKPYKGAYLILKRKSFTYNDWYIHTDQGTNQTVITDDLAGGNINVTDAVIDPRLSIRSEIPTADAQFKFINVIKNGTVQRPTGTIEVSSADIETGSTSNMLCSISGSTVTFSNQYNNEIRRYFTTDFQIRVAGTTYGINAVNTGSITIDQTLTAPVTNSAFTIIIPNRSPDIGDYRHPTSSDINATAANTAGWGDFTWGMFPSKFLNNTVNQLFEGTDTYVSPGAVGTTINNVATRSPFFSNKDGEDFAIDNDAFFSNYMISAGFTNYDWGSSPQWGETSLMRCSDISKAIFPCFGNNLNDATIFPAETANTADATIGAAIGASYPGLNQFAYFDHPLNTKRAHSDTMDALTTDPAQWRDPNSSDAIIDSSSRNIYCYPYVSAEYGYRTEFVTQSDPMYQQAFTDENCITIYDFNEVIPPGTTIEVTLQTVRNYIYYEAPWNPTVNLNLRTPANDVGTYSRMQPTMGEYEIILVAK